MKRSGIGIPLLLAAIVFVAALILLQRVMGPPEAGAAGQVPMQPGRRSQRPAPSADRSNPDTLAGDRLGGSGTRSAASGSWEDLPESLDTSEQVILLADPEAVGQVATLAETLGIRVAGRNAVLGALRLVATQNQLDQLRAKSDVPFVAEANALVYVPYIGQETVREFVAGKPFGTNAHAAIGVGQVGEDWGEGVTLAILDTGVVDHPSLVDAMISSWDLVNEQPPTAGPFSGHGTAVASLIMGNGQSVQGLAPHADVLSIKVVDSFGVGDAFTLASGIVLAVDSGASVINISLGTDNPSAVLRQAVQYAEDHGVVIVASAGNDGGDVLYPAAFSEVAAVGAIDATGTRAAYSNSGAGLDIVAPGTGVVAAWSEDQNVAMTGTSASAPFVTGALLVLLGQEPDTTPREALQAVLATANDAGAPAADDEYGHGTLTVNRALRRNEPGHVDAALASHYLPRLQPVDGQIGVVVTAENRGTEVIGALTLVSEFAGNRLQRRFVNVAPGETVSMPAGIPEDLISPEDGLILRSRIDMDGSDDDRGNDTLTSRITVTVLE